KELRSLGADYLIIEATKISFITKEANQIQARKCILRGINGYDYIMIMLCMRSADMENLREVKEPRPFLSIEKNPIQARELLIWIQKSIPDKFFFSLKDKNGNTNVAPLNQFLSRHRITSYMLRKIGANHASRVHGGKNDTGHQYLQQLACRHKIGHASSVEYYGCGNNVEILDQANPLGTVSNLPLTNPKEASQSTGISPLMCETFIPPILMEEIEDIATQQVKSNLRCAKCSEDLSSCLLPIGFLRFSLQLQGPLKPLIYLTCKHIIHYNCIDNPQKLYPICPSTIIEPEEEEELSVDSEEQPDTSSKKCFNEGTDVNSSTPKKKAKKAVRREDLPILKKLIKELSAPIPQQSSSGSIISLQTFPNMDISSVNFCELDNKIINAKDSNKKTILESLLKSNKPSLDLVLKVTVSLDLNPSFRISLCFPNVNEIKNLILKNIVLVKLAKPKDKK
ncbi:7713_t:CDS:2, partial [Dentiscutata erythropus]